MKPKNFTWIAILITILGFALWWYSRTTTPALEKISGLSLSVKPAMTSNQVELPRASVTQPNSGRIALDASKAQAIIDLNSAMAGEKEWRERMKQQTLQRLQDNKDKTNEMFHDQTMKHLQEDLTEFEQPMPPPTILGKLELADGVPEQITLVSGELVTGLLTVQANGLLHVDFSWYETDSSGARGGGVTDAKPGETITGVYNNNIIQFTPTIKSNTSASSTNAP